jgi:hypothetical protein
MQVYENGLYCWVCKARMTHEEYAKLTGNQLEKSLVVEAKPKEDIGKMMAYIAGLPLVSVRGLLFPTDSHGYYIVWPDGSYYKRRNISEDGPKYKNPSGVRAPLLVCNASAGVEYLAIVEGEINALSVAAACPGLTVCSPGSAGDLPRRENLQFFSTFRRHLIVVDEDEAGAMGAIQLSSMLREHSLHTQIVMFKKKAKGGVGDPNEQIQEAKGKEELKARILSRLRPPPS